MSLEARTTWKFVAPEFVFGAGTRELAGRYAKNFGVHKALVVTDPGVIAAGWTSDVIASLERSEILYAVFSNVTPNPRAEEVMEGAEVYDRERCNAIVVVGGGSPIDCAKGIGIVHSNQRHILTFEGVDQVPSPGPPLICVPTTAGSSADVSQFALITDLKRRAKVEIVSKAIVPDVSLIDPVTTTTMPSFVAACSGIDAFTHAVEAFVSTLHSPVTDLMALEAIRLIAQSLSRVLADPDDMEARRKQMLGSMEAGLAFSNASLGAVHALAHALGGLSDIAHGQCEVPLLAPIIAFNFYAAPDRYRLIGEAMGLEIGGMSAHDQRSTLVDAIVQLARAPGIKQKLSQVGIPKSAIPALADEATADVCMVTNPRPPTRPEIEALLEEAF